VEVLEVAFKLEREETWQDPASTIDDGREEALV
jgi:hypothetical protein